MSTCILFFFVMVGFFLFLPWVDAVSLHRFYSPVYNGHFYTQNDTEKDLVLDNAEWQYEGRAYEVSESTDAVPVYRFWSENYKHHFFTVSPGERDMIIATDANWAYEGIVFSVAEMGDAVYRFYSPVYRGHFFTASAAEKEHLIDNDSNWNYEGIAWYVAPESEPLVALGEVDTGTTAKSIEFLDISPSVYPGASTVHYDVSSSGTVTPTLHVTDAKVWEVVYALAPSDEIRENIREFDVYYDAASSTAAHVASVGGEVKEWRISINYAALENFSQFPFLIAHEYAHIFSLADEQVTTIAEDFTIDTTCTSAFALPGICYHADSYMNRFYATYWLEMGVDIGRDRTTGETETYFSANSDAFISAYATTNPREDFAETFAAYVFSDSAGADTVRDQKVISLNQYDSLLTYKKNIRQTVAGWAD